MLTLTVSSRTIAACPEMRLDAGHYWPDGKSCRHDDRWNAESEVR